MFVDIDQAPIYVNRDGDGDDALLLHGVPDSAEIWTPLIARIKHHYRCHAPDLPGFYRSGIPKNFRFELDHYADFIDTLVEKLELKTPLTLIIHDWGGLFGMLWACKYPHKVKHIVGGDFPFDPGYRWHEWARVWRTPILGELSMAMMNWPLFKWELSRTSCQLSEQDIRDTYEGRVTQASTRATVLKLYRSAGMHQFGPWMKRQHTLADKVPIDLIWGARDKYVGPEEGRKMAHRSLTAVPDCGHWPPMEVPESYATVLLTALEQEEPCPPLSA